MTRSIAGALTSHRTKWVALVFWIAVVAVMRWLVVAPRSTSTCNAPPPTTGI